MCVCVPVFSVKHGKHVVLVINYTCATVLDRDGRRGEKARLLDSRFDMRLCAFSICLQIGTTMHMSCHLSSVHFAITQSHQMENVEPCEYKYLKVSAVIYSKSI